MKLKFSPFNAVAAFIVLLIGIAIITLSVVFTLRRNNNDNDNDNDTATSTTPYPSPVFSPTAVGHECGNLDNQCSFVDDFSSLNNSQWIASNDQSNGSPFGVWWDKNTVSFPTLHENVTRERNGNNDSESNRMIQIELVKRPSERHNKTYASGQLKSRGWFQYGCFEANIQPFNQPGVPGTPLKKHNEIDIEFLYRPLVNRTIMQTNYYTDGGEQHNKFVSVRFAVDAMMNRYGMKWTSHDIRWYVNGRQVRRVIENVPSVEKGGPLRMFFNFWSIGEQYTGAQKWAGKYIHDEKNLPKTKVDWVKYTNGEECKIVKDE